MNTTEAVATQQFSTVLRGWDKDEVRELLATLATKQDAMAAAERAAREVADASRARVADLEGSLTHAQAQLDQARGCLAATLADKEALAATLAENVARATAGATPGAGERPATDQVQPGATAQPAKLVPAEQPAADLYAQVGAEIASVLRASEQAASSVREAAAQEAASEWDKVERAGRKVLSEARTKARKLTHQAEADAMAMLDNASGRLELATRQAEELVANARREVEELLSVALAEVERLRFTERQLRGGLEAAASWVMRSLDNPLEALAAEPSPFSQAREESPRLLSAG
ncbi:MAG: hypothetical protein ACRDWV_01230 [Acidimicrobiales bacterium]